MPDTEVSTGKFTVQRLPPLVEPTPAELPPSATRCANCDVGLTGPYCARCGQHVADFHRSVWRFAADFFDNTICWDNKLLRTLGPLFRQPGFLTREFMRGRRVRYVHPLRLFLFTSAVCLTLLQFSHNKLIEINPPQQSSAKGKKGLHLHVSNPALPTVAPAASPPDASRTPTPDGANEKVAETGDDDDGKDPTADAIRRAVAEKVAKARADGGADPDDTGTGVASALADRIEKGGGAAKLSRTINDGVMQRLSWVALALLPVFALGLRALYWRNDRYYFEHLIFSLHYHTFLLLFWTAYTGALAVVAFLPFHSFLGAVLRLGLLVPPVYLFLALRGMYGDGPKRTLVKVLILGTMHLLAIVIGVAAVGAFIFLAPGK